MATPTRTQNTSNKPNPLVIAGLVAVIVLAVCLVFWFMPHTDVIKSPDSPNITELKKMAAQSQGDFSKLSPADQAKADQLSNNHGAQSISMYYQPSAK